MVPLFIPYPKSQTDLLNTLSQMMSLLHSKSYSSSTITFSVEAEFLRMVYKVQVTITFFTVTLISSLLSFHSKMLASTQFKAYARKALIFGPVLQPSIRTLPLSHTFDIGLNLSCPLNFSQFTFSTKPPFIFYSILKSPHQTIFPTLCLIFFHSISYLLIHDIIYFLIMFMV